MCSIDLLEASALIEALWLRKSSLSPVRQVFRLCGWAPLHGRGAVVVVSVIRPINRAHIWLDDGSLQCKKPAADGGYGSPGVTGSLRLSNSRQRGLGWSSGGAEERRGRTICHFHCRWSTSDAATPAVKLYECFCWASSTPTAFIRQAPRLFFLPSRHPLLPTASQTLIFYFFFQLENSSFMFHHLS